MNYLSSKFLTHALTMAIAFGIATSFMNDPQIMIDRGLADTHLQIQQNLAQK